MSQKKENLGLQNHPVDLTFMDYSCLELPGRADLGIEKRTLASFARGDDFAEGFSPDMSADLICRVFGREKAEPAKLCCPLSDDITEQMHGNESGALLRRLPWS